MTYRGKPLFLRPDSWRVIACVALLGAVLNIVAAVFSAIDGTGFPLGNIVTALGFMLCAIFSLMRARSLER